MVHCQLPGCQSTSRSSYCQGILHAWTVIACKDGVVRLRRIEARRRAGLTDLPDQIEESIASQHGMYSPMISEAAAKRLLDILPSHVPAKDGSTGRLPLICLGSGMFFGTSKSTSHIELGKGSLVCGLCPAIGVQLLFPCISASLIISGGLTYVRAAVQGSGAPITYSSTSYHVCCAGYPPTTSDYARNALVADNKVDGLAERTRSFAGPDILRGLSCPACLYAASLLFNEADRKTGKWTDTSLTACMQLTCN
jgi:hypothetical protein